MRPFLAWVRDACRSSLLLAACAIGAGAAAARSWKGNAVDTLGPLAAAGVALVHAVGDADDVVPPAETALLVEARDRALGGTIEVIHKPGVGRRPHGLDDPARVVAFLPEHAVPR